MNDNHGQIRRRPRTGLKNRMSARRSMRIPSHVAAVTWLAGPGEQPQLASARCAVMRVMRHPGLAPLHAMAVYRPAVDKPTGMVKLGPAQCEGLYDLSVSFEERAARRLAQDKQLGLAAMHMQDVIAGGGYELSADALLPSTVFGYRSMPQIEASPRLLARARLEFGDEPTADQVAAAFEMMATEVGGEWRLPADLLLRRPGAYYASHPCNGSGRPADGDTPPRDGQMGGDGWVFRYGEWYPMVQAPDSVRLDLAGLVGDFIAVDNPATRLLEQLGLVATGDDPRRWSQARRAEFTRGMADPALSYRAEPETPSLLEILDRRMAAQVARSSLFTAEDRMRNLMNPWDYPWSSTTPQVFVMRNDDSALRYVNTGWDFDVATLPPAFRAHRPAASSAAIPAC